ncbi:HSP70 and/or MreB Mbl domain containing protein, partial [Asbolus verrucosus]
MKSELVVGIDLGTTNSAVAIYRNNELKILENSAGNYTTPSFVYFADMENVSVGKNAKRMAAQKPEHGVYGKYLSKPNVNSLDTTSFSDIKRFIGRQFYEVESQQNLSYLPFIVENVNGEPMIFIEKYGIQESPEDISAHILQQIKKDIKIKLGEDVDKAVITVPAHFNVSQRKATLKAAEQAGFKVLKLLNEPTAAALNYFCENKDSIPEKKYYLVYDLGGGTFDVAILERTAENIDIISIDGDSFLGGHDFDNLIKNYICDSLEETHKSELNKRNLRRIANESVEVKEHLSTSESGSVILEGVIDIKDSIEIQLTRSQFEKMAANLFTRTIDIVDRCIKNSELTKDDISEIILAGGSTYIPKIQELLSNYFDGKQLNRTLHPEECVAKGAALQAAMLSKSSHQKIKEFKVTEVTPSSLGVGDVSYKMDFVIRRNTPIPTNASVTHATVTDNQAAINLKIYEGERMDVRKNICLGNFKITNLTPAPPGKCKIKIIMTIDANGILTVTAKEKLKENSKDLQIAYTKANRTYKLGRKGGDRVQEQLEDKRFMELAKIHEFLITYIAGVEYNMKNKKITSTERNELQRCFEIRKEIANGEDSEDKVKLMNLGVEMMQLCEPIVKKYNFKQMPRSAEIESKLKVRNLMGVTYDSDSDGDAEMEKHLKNSNLVVGIDLGTTNSGVALFKNGRVDMLENKDGDYITPSYVFINDKNTASVGKIAKYMAPNKPEHCIYDNVGGEPLVYIKEYSSYKSPIEISQLILNKIKNDVNTKLGTNVNKAVITVPAHFNVSQRKATLKAAEDAGFTVLKLLNEPTAAALNYYYECTDVTAPKTYSLVYDLGGGTFDVAVLERNGDNINIICVDGDSYLGGHDFDNIITNYVLKELKKKYNYDPHLDKRKMRLIRNQCIEAKEHLSVNTEVPLYFEGLVEKIGCAYVSLTRTQFEEMAADLFKRAMEIVDRCIQNIQLTKEDISEVILAGGSTRVPKIEEMLTEYFNGRAPKKILHPEQCVAKGAALQAAMLSKSPDQKIQEFKISEVTAASLGFGDVSDKMNIIIKKNTPIPATEAATFATVYNNQSAMVLKIYEGERTDVKKNVCLGTFKITNLTQAPPGKCKIKSVIKVDTNGILTVTASENLKDNARCLQIVYVKANKVEKRKSDIKDRQEDKNFEEIAKIHEYLVLYGSAVQYNFQNKKHKITPGHIDDFKKCDELQEQIRSAKKSKDKQKLLDLGRELMKICEPLAKKYDSVYDSDDERFQGARLVEDDTLNS